MAPKTPIRIGSLLLGPRKVNRGREYFCPPTSNDPRKSACTPARVSKGSRNRSIERRPFSITSCAVKLLSMRLLSLLFEKSSVFTSEVCKGPRCRLELTGIGDEVESCGIKKTGVSYADAFRHSNR